MRLRAGAICAALMLATGPQANANGPAAPQAAPEAAAEDPCAALSFAGLVGQSGEVARLLVLDRPLRVIGVGQPVTRDYLQQRINFDLDEDDRIARVWCG